MTEAALRRTSSHQQSPVRILSISAAGEDHAALRQIATGMPCRIASAGTCQHAFRRLDHGRVAIVVCERDLPDGDWHDILDHIKSSSLRPSLIVTSRVADDSLWAEVLNLGGFDVIAKPFHPRETRHVLETACLDSRRAS
jgi:DNA-binding response OmpR family regulator